MESSTESGIESGEIFAMGTRLEAQNWQQIEAGLGPNLTASAKQAQALQRKRQIRSGGDLLRLVLMYAISGWSLRLLGAWAQLQGIGSLSDVAILKRLRNSQRWLGLLIGQLLQQRGHALQSFPGMRVRLMDATVITQPGSRGTNWRVHLGFDLERGCLDGIEVTDAHGGESLARFAGQADEIRVADRGYAHAKGLGSLLASFTALVVRINWHNLRLEGSSGQRFVLIDWLKQVTVAQERSVWLTTPNGRFALRLLALPLPPQAAEAARRRTRKTNSKKGRQVSAETLLAAGFVLLVSNLPAEQWSLERVGWLYRLRWQIELEIKRLKSLLRLDDLRAQDPQLVQTFLLGKLLAALLLDEVTHQVSAYQPDWFSSLERPVSVWRLTDLLWQLFRQRICGPLVLERFFDYLPTLARYFCDAPRARPQQLAWARALLEHLAFSFSGC